MSEPKVQLDPQVFELTAVHHEPDTEGLAFGTTEWYEDAVTGAGRIGEGESLDELADRALLAVLVERPWRR